MTTGVRVGRSGASTLTNAHAYPNPFKPNSALGHTEITFIDLTPGAHIKIFTAAGEPVFDRKADAAATTLQWSATNEGGEAVASGVYYFLITDDAGNKKEGKLAVIR